MDQDPKTISESQKYREEGAATFLDYIAVLLKWWRFIVINTLIVAALAAGISFLFPNWYRATASILPPKQQDILGSAIGASPILKGLTGGKALGMMGRSAGSYNYLAILKSRTSLEDVINKFDLVNVYNISNHNMDKAVKQLENNTMFEVQDEENITIDVFDKEPKRAADIANYFVEILNSTSIRLGTQEARNVREFIGRRLDQCRHDLQRAEDGVKEFQEKKDLIITESASNSSISAYAELYAMKAKKEIELAVLEKEVAPDNETLRQSRMEYAELSKKLSTFPAAGLEGVRLYREVIAQEKILEFLLPIFEQARIDEQKDLPVLLVLDKAAPPQQKATPQRMLIVSLFSFLGLSVLILISFFFNGLAIADTTQSPLIQKLKIWANRTIALYRVS